jgi:YHS domain-containing protein
MKLMVTILLVFSACQGICQSDAFRSKQFNLDDGIAIKGYDPVAYFTQSKAVKGKKELTVLSHGISYHFASAEDKELFQANPDKFEPQYGGWCAYAMGHDGSKVEVDPETFKIINGKLFLFYNRFFNNTMKTWDQDELRLHNQADVNWQKLLQQ